MAGWNSTVRFELEAGDLEHRPGVAVAFIHELDDRYADVAADERGHSGLFDNFADQRGGGGLAIGAGNCEDLALEEARGQFEFSDDGRPKLGPAPVRACRGERRG